MSAPNQTPHPREPATAPKGPETLAASNAATGASITPDEVDGLASNICSKNMEDKIYT